MIFSWSNNLFSVRMVHGWRSGGGHCWRATHQGIAGWKLIETMGGGGSRSRPQASPGRIPHRTIDFRMPEKTQTRSQRNCLGCGLFELLRRGVAQRRVQPAAIVVTIDKVFDVRAQVIQIPIVVSVDLLPF